MSVFDRLWGRQRAHDVLEAEAAGPGGHAFLLVGPPGVGKSQAARAFGAALVCPDRGCGACEACRRALEGLHPDVGIFQPEGYTYPVETIREMVAMSSQTPLEATRRVFIVEEADRIVERSQNALLKALEEPNSSVTWVLLADALDPFLPTILSRCRVVTFAPVSEEQVVSLLTERSAIDEATARQIARASRGELTSAIALSEEGPIARVRRLAYEAACRKQDAAGALGLADRLGALVDEARKIEEQAQAVEVERLDQKLGTSKGSAGVRRRVTDRHKRALRRVETDLYLAFLKWVAQANRDLAFVAGGGDPAHSTALDLADELAAAAGSRPTKVWLDAAEGALAARKAVAENASPQVTVEAVLLRPLT